jgi:uncharacterized protein YwqG
MRNVYLLCFCLCLLVVFTGCADRLNENFLSNELNQSQNVTENRNLTKEEQLKEKGLPLVGENVFDPTKIKIGNKVQSLVLKDIQVFEGTNDYPYDTLKAVFEGSVKLTGTVEFVKKDNEIRTEDYLLFEPDSSSSKKLPVSHHESLNRAIVFENQTDAISMLDLIPGEKIENVNIELADFTINYLPTDAQNTAKLLKIIQ